MTTTPHQAPAVLQASVLQAPAVLQASVAQEPAVLQEPVYRFSKGPAASNTYLTHAEDGTTSQLTIDWSYDGVYFIYKNEKVIIISIGPTTLNENSKHFLTINASLEKKETFRKLFQLTGENLSGYSEKTDRVLNKIDELIYYYSNLRSSSSLAYLLSETNKDKSLIFSLR